MCKLLYFVFVWPLRGAEVLKLLFPKFLGCHTGVVCSVFVRLLHGSEILKLLFFWGGGAGLVCYVFVWLLHGADIYKLLFLFFQFLSDHCAGLIFFFGPLRGAELVMFWFGGCALRLFVFFGPLRGAEFVMFGFGGCALRLVMFFWAAARG